MQPDKDEASAVRSNTFASVVFIGGFPLVF
jgi:hypothetical protein